MGGTQLCAPLGSRFSGLAAGYSEQIVLLVVTYVNGGSAVYLTQATQSFGYPVPLIAAEDALLRVFITSASDLDTPLPTVRTTFYEHGAEVYAVDIPGGGTTIPREINEGDLSVTANARIPGRVLAPGLEMLVEIDPERRPGSGPGHPGPPSP